MVASILLMGCLFAAPPEIGSADLQKVGLQKEVAKLVKRLNADTNAERKAVASLPALKENAELDKSAAAKVADLFAKQYFEHESPDGKGPSDLALAAGYKYAIIGENLAEGNFESDQAVMDAWLSGLELAKANGHDLSTIESVASFFVSRVDTEVDKRLSPDSPLRGTAAIANARVAYEAFGAVQATDRWKALQAEGARPQRPLWASTGVKEKAYSDTRYVIDLVTANVVNTMPEATLDAVRDHGEPHGDTIVSEFGSATDALAALAAAGIDMADVVQVLEVEGVGKFVDSWTALLATVQEALLKARAAAGR